MPTLTDPQIDSACDAEALVRLLIDAGEQLPPRLRERILSFGPAVVPPLIALFEDEDLALETAPGEGWAPIHAADLLGELRATEAIEPMVRYLADDDWESILYNQVMEALPKVGAPALEPVLAAYDAAADRFLRMRFAGVLAGLRVRDDRIYELLTSELEHDPEPGAMHLADYGDPRAIPLLSAALDAFEPVVDDENLMANHVVVEFEDAIKRLGGQLTPEQQAKVKRIFAMDQPKRDRLTALLEHAVGQADLETSAVPGARALLTGVRPARAARKVGRNDPCPCGSGKKYKKCCLGKG
jgi:HEAT repeat protein